MKKLTVISISLFLLTNLIYSQDIINETGKNGKFIVRDAEKQEALIVEDGNVAIIGELKIENMNEGKESDGFVVWDSQDKSIKVVPRVFSKVSPLTKPLISKSIHNDIDGINKSNSNQSVMDIEALTIVHTGAVGIDGSFGIGTDIDGTENFGFNTLLLKENNLRIHFDDTSTVPDYSANDWTIEINSAMQDNDGYFGIRDATEVSMPFRIEAGAPDHSLYVDSHGDVGINTSTPYYELHIVDGDSPAIRLEQDASYGWTPQKWDLCGNESNFFIRDATHASKLPFRIEPEAPTDAIFIKSDGKIGLGTGSPSYPLHVQRTGINASVVVERTSGAINYMNAAATHGTFGTVNNFVARIAQNAQVKIFLDKDSNGLYFGSAGNITSRSDADIDMTITSTGRVGIGTTWPSKKLYVNGSAGGTQAWNASDERYKKNIITVDNPLEDLLKLRGVEYEWIDQSNDESTGFDTKVHYGVIAQEVEEIFPYLVDNVGETELMKHIEYNGFIAILIESIKEQQELIEELQKEVNNLKKLSTL